MEKVCSPALGSVVCSLTFGIMDVTPDPRDTLVSEVCLSIPLLFVTKNKRLFLNIQQPF